MATVVAMADPCPYQGLTLFQAPCCQVGARGGVQSMEYELWDELLLLEPAIEYPVQPPTALSPSLFASGRCWSSLQAHNGRATRQDGLDPSISPWRKDEIMT